MAFKVRTLKPKERDRILEVVLNARRQQYTPELLCEFQKIIETKYYYWWLMDLKKEECDKSLIQSILESQKKLDLAHKNFEYAKGDLVDYYAYQIKSEQAKIDYLLKQAKNKKVVINAINSKK